MINPLKKVWGFFFNPGPPKPPGAPPAVKGRLDELHPSLVGLLETLPKNGGMSADSRDRFDKAFLAAMDYVYPKANQRK